MLNTWDSGNTNPLFFRQIFLVSFKNIIWCKINNFNLATLFLLKLFPEAYASQGILHSLLTVDYQWASITVYWATSDVKT